MALPASGTISLNDVNIELGLASGATISLNDAAVRGLFGIASGTISLADGYGKSSSSVDGTLLHTIVDPNPYSGAGSDNFGYAVKSTDAYTIVGAPAEDDAGGTSSGKAYIYNTATGALLYTLNNPNAYGTSANDRFGYAVGISASYAIVSAYQEDEAAGADSGKAYIFSTTTGSLLRTLNNPNAYSTPALDYFGASVAVSESYAIVGAHLEDSASGSSSGIAYIFSTTTGSLLHTLNNPDPTASDYLGYFLGVDICDNYAIVAALLDDAAGTNSGTVYIYNPATGALLHTVSNPNNYLSGDYDQFGGAVAICDSYFIVGARYEDDPTGTSSGAAYIFSTATGALLHTLTNPNPYGSGAADYFGASVGISQAYAIVGAFTEDQPGMSNSGKVYIYSTATGALLHTLNDANAYGTPANDYFGFSVSISENYAVVGAYREDSAGGADSGAVYIYD